ncbi:MAG: DUF4168 domain-containing protein [Fibrobacterota bacterium]
MLKHLTLLFAFSLCLAFTVTAQESAAPTENIPVNSENLQKAATAYNDITNLNEALREALQSTQNQQQRQEMQQKTNEEMIKSVENSGLTIDEYNHIITQVRSNKELSKKFEGYLKE